LPVNGGFDENGLLTRDPGTIRVSRRSLPIGYWKGSGLSIMLDMLAAGLSGGKSVAQITKDGPEYAMSQFFLCFDAKSIDVSTLEEIISFTREQDDSDSGSTVRYPGEQTLATRIKTESEGIEVNEKAWRDVQAL